MPKFFVWGNGPSTVKEIREGEEVRGFYTGKDAGAYEWYIETAEMTEDRSVAFEGACDRDPSVVGYEMAR